MDKTERERRVIILLGPTGVGKTGVSLLIAKSLKTEIISADSMQIYKGMDIGTAKPTPEERRVVKHHMIDILTPSERYSTGRYIGDIYPIIENLHKAGKVPLIVGGTGLYVKAMTRGLFSAPEADLDLRAKLMERERRSPGILYQELSKIDQKKALSINPSDKRRIIRSLEVSFKTKRPISELQQELTLPLPYEYLKIGLRRGREELYRVIEKRVDGMFDQGLVEEVKNLLKMNPSETPMQAIGYKEVIGYLRGGGGLEETKEFIKRATKRYAKRQYTWFRKEENIQWVDITSIFDPVEIFKKINELTLSKL